MGAGDGIKKGCELGRRCSLWRRCVLGDGQWLRRRWAHARMVPQEEMGPGKRWACGLFPREEIGPGRR